MTESDSDRDGDRDRARARAKERDRERQRETERAQGGLDSFLLRFSESLLRVAGVLRALLVESTRLHLRALWAGFKSQEISPAHTLSLALTPSLPHPRFSLALSL